MERWLNSRAALMAAWSVVGILVLGALGFATYLVLPAIRGDSGGSTGERALREGTVAAQPTATRAAGPTQLSGTVERVEGQALVVKVTGEGTLRVLVRADTAVGRVSDTTAVDMRAGEPATITYTTQANGRLSGTRVRLQPPNVPVAQPSTDARPGGNSSGPITVAGTIVAIDGAILRLITDRGERTIELSPSARYQRFSPVGFTEIRAGQRIGVFGEYLVDGSLAALSIQLFGTP